MCEVDKRWLEKKFEVLIVKRRRWLLWRERLIKIVVEESVVRREMFKKWS